jgi:hypothetical protein
MRAVGYCCLRLPHFFVENDMSLWPPAATTCPQVRFLSLTFTDFEVCEQEVEEGQKIVHVVNDKQRVS